MKTTKFKVNDTAITVESDDPKMHELLARLVVEKAAAVGAPALGEEAIREAVRKLVTSCRQEPTQYAILKLLAESGKATRSGMLEAGKAAARAAGKETFHHENLSLAGCRGSISKKAQGFGLDENWWRDSLSQAAGEHITELDPRVYKHLKELMVAVK